MSKIVSNGWALKLPNGDLLADSFATTRDQCWSYSFEVIADREGKGWLDDNWKQWRASMKSSEKLGYKMVKVRLVEGWE